MTNDDGAALGIEAARRLVVRSPGDCRIEPGLTADEFARIEDEFGFAFADDHRAFLTAGLPVSLPREEVPGVYHAWAENWPDWRSGDRGALRERLDWPRDSVQHDIDHGYAGRGPDADLARRTARAALDAAPPLVPVYSHRFLPAGRGSFGHPVLSVWGTDIISYGVDLADWTGREFGGDRGWSASDRSPQVTVPYWKDFLY